MEKEKGKRGRIWIDNEDIEKAEMERKKNGKNLKKKMNKGKGES